MDELAKGGLKGDFWKTFAESGDDAFYANYNGVFKFAAAGTSAGGVKSNIQEITDGYFYQLYKSLCSRVQRSDIKFLVQELYATYNTKDEEYWIRFKTEIPSVVLTGTPSLIVMIDEQNDISTPHFQITKNVAGTFVRIAPISTSIVTVLYKFVDTTGEGIPVDASGNILFTAQNDEWWEVTFNQYSTDIFTFKKVDKELNEQKDTFLFSFSNREGQMKWLGVYDYDFDTFNSFDNKLYGQQDRGGAVSTYSLGEGVIINDDKLKMRIFATMNPQIQQSYIFERLRMNSSDKADIKTYDVNDMAVALATLAQGGLKNYNAFENYIPRELVARYKNQGTHILYQIYKQLTDKQFFVNSITFFYNKIK